MADDGPTTIEVRVIPRARRDEVGGERAGRLLVRTTAAPTDGKANAAVCRLVAAHLGCRARDACPAGEQYRYGEAQRRFHMAAFIRARGVEPIED